MLLEVLNPTKRVTHNLLFFPEKTIVVNKLPAILTNSLIKQYLLTILELLLFLGGFGTHVIYWQFWNPYYLPIVMKLLVFYLHIVLVVASDFKFFVL